MAKQIEKFKKGQLVKASYPNGAKFDAKVISQSSKVGKVHYSDETGLYCRVDMKKDSRYIGNSIAVLNKHLKTR